MHGNFQYDSQPGSTIPAVVMEVAILAELQSQQVSVEWGPGYQEENKYMVNI